MRSLQFALALAFLGLAGSVSAQSHEPADSTVAFEGMDCPADQPRHLEKAVRATPVAAVAGICFRRTTIRESTFMAG